MELMCWTDHNAEAAFIYEGRSWCHECLEAYYQQFNEHERKIPGIVDQFHKPADGE